MALAKYEYLAKALIKNNFIPPAKAGGNSNNIEKNKKNRAKEKNLNNPFNLWHKEIENEKINYCILSAFSNHSNQCKNQITGFVYR